jgi:predicted RNA binding protein YcfA (HicA-like mRNA interferase family)
LRIPRDLSADQLINLLIKKLDFAVTRQVGSYIRLCTNYTGEEYRITIPNHSFIKIGTLNAILNEIANYLGINKDELIKKLFA